MFFLRLAYTSLRSLEVHFLRSLLATLGVLIGVGSVVACMSILEGASNKIIADFKSMGSNLLYVFPARARVHSQDVGSAQTLTLKDIRELRKACPEQIDEMAPEAFKSVLVRHIKKSDHYNLVATSDAYFRVNDFEAERGNVFSRQQSDDSLSRVVCLGSKVSEDLFGGMDPVGQSITIDSKAFRVIGVMEKRGSLGFFNVDKTVFVPIKTGLKRFLNQKHLNRLSILATDSEGLDELRKRIKSVLRRTHRIGVGQEDDFNIFNQEEALRNITQAIFIFRVVFYSIAGISLVVGGIGIMNIMLVSVTERTREIGVRIAVGARRGDILFQFLIEALIISLLGGGFGLLLGWMFADLLEKCLEDIFRTEITSMVIIVSLTTATIVGVVSGIYPAIKASRLDPVDALRYE